MALSQLQCLDDNHVNPRTHESKPDFFYCEDQRLALEALMRDGREAFFKYLEARGLRGFLSDPELETLIGSIEPYDPGSELFSGDVENEQTPLSLHYWPDLSDTSIPQMDLGWPDSDAYRGVTRTTVYTQPPLDGHVHIKEVVRKMIAQAQKVIAVVMDVFTDVDIFRDLIDAGFKRRVSVYILLERTTLPHFLAMCQRANVHAGHLKHLRVRCTGGAEFYTRSCTKIRGRMSHKFMFIDGDKAVSGSYSFTWMASRLDRNLITVVTGQAVDGFDQLFRILYVTSSSVDLRQIVTEPEPEPDPLPQPVTVAPPSAAIARKLYNPKYALVALTNPSPTPKNQESPKEPEKPEDSKNKRRRKASKEAIQEAPPLHPGLTNLEKACLITYLPTWPEPDPPSDVIGFINIRDANKPTQVHLQRSEMFETSQAIRFSSPFSKVKETQPEVANPTQLTPKQEEENTLQPAQDKSKADEVIVKTQEAELSAAKSKEEAFEQKSTASGQKSDLDTDTANSVSAGNKFDSHTATNPNTGLDTPPLSAQKLPQSSSKASTPNEGKISHKAQPVCTNSHTESGSLPNLNTEKEAAPSSSLNTQSYVVHRADTPILNGTHASQLPDSPELNTEQGTKENTTPSHADSHTQGVHKQPQISTEVASNIQTPTIHSNISTSPVSATQSKNNYIPITTVHSSTSTSASVPSTSSSSSLPPLTSSSTTLNPPLPASSSLTPAPPVPKPRTVQLVITDSNIGNGQKLPEICLVKKPKPSTGPLLAHSAVDVASVEQASLVRECQTIPELQDDSASKTGAQKDTENTGNPKETPKQDSESQETRSMEADGRDDDRGGSQMVTRNKLQAQSDVLINVAPKAASLEIQERIPIDVDPKTSKDRRMTEKMDTECVATVQADTTGPERTLTGSEFDGVPNQKGENATKCRTFLARAHEPQKISYSKMTPQDMGQLEALTAPVFCASNRLHTSKDNPGNGGHTSAADTRSQPDKQAKFTHEVYTDSMLDTTKHSTHSTSQEPNPTSRVGTHTPEKALRLHLTETHLPDLRSQTPECKSQSLTVCTPTPDGFPSLTPTPDSPSHASDFLTPTSDNCDPHISREDSTLSTTSEEYYECSDSPFNEPVFDHTAYCNHDMIEDHVSSTHTNTLNAPAAGTSPAYINYSSADATLGSAHSETQTLTGPARVSSSSSLKLREAENTTHEENGSEENKHRRKLSVAERREEQESQGTERRGSEEANRTVDCFKRDARKVALSQSAADRLTDGGVTATKERTKTKQSSTGDLKPAAVSSEGWRADKESSGMEKASNQVEVRPRAMERRVSPQSSRKTERQKLLHSSPKPQRVQQHSVASSPSRPPGSPRSILDMQALGPHPWGKRQPNQTESKVFQRSLSFSNNTSALHKPPTTPPQPGAAGPVGFVAGWKQVSHSQQSQAPAAQSQAQLSLVHTNPETQLSPQSHNQTASAQDAHGQEGTTQLGFTFSKLYNLKGMKGKVNKTAAQSKRGSATAPVQERNSTS